MRALFLSALLTVLSAAAWGRGPKVYYRISADKKSVEKVQGPETLHSYDVIGKCGAPAVGLPEVRKIARNRDSLQVVFGKHDYAEIDLNSDAIRCLGSN